MHNIVIPKFYEDKLSNTNEAALVQQYISTFDEWYHLNDCTFFREYTDHGTKHIVEVLSTAELLLTDESKEKFSAADCALLICSTLLHDFAMHLQENSFLELVTSNSVAVGAHDFGDKSWKILWKEYVSEIHRLSENERMNLFGVSDPICPPDLDDTESWRQSQYRYIGEFIRRHHPRIAYEISRNGIPGTQGILPISQIDKSSPIYNLSMLSGIIARSHGMKLRDTFDVLERDYHLRVFQPNSHPIYVMVILRIADYVQLQNTRAPGDLLKIKRLKSPLSQSEWGLHDAIQGVSFDTEQDPEVLKIQIDPTRSNISSYLKTKRLLENIQYELDSSWAVLGEVYGRFSKDNWGITIRRIRSNIEDKDHFGRLSGFIPEMVEFSSANTELTKLLIKPLYGDYPEIAVRELVQNAIDACRERVHYENVTEERNLDQYFVKVELINNPEGTITLRISDTGIGMTLDVLKNYFLKAGSSFRTSLAWKKQFANDNSKSEILRTGRFGVGALAAFLIADDPSEIKLSVHSRHIKANPEEAISFDTTLSDAPISVNFKSKNDIGTVISVTTSSPPSFMRAKESEANDGESWDWYCLEWPKVERSLSTGKVLPQRYRIPSKPSERQLDNFKLNFIDAKGFDSVSWYYGEGHLVVCNGIRVIKKQTYKNVLQNLFEEKTIIGSHTLKFPNISVMDKDGLLPLTLDRLRLDFDQIPFTRELREDVLLSFVLALAVSAPDITNEKSYSSSDDNLESILNSFDGMDKTAIAWVITNGKISPFSGRSLNHLKGKRIIEIYSLADLKFIKSPDKYSIILTKKSIHGSISNNISSKKFIHFLSDTRARERLERLADMSRNEAGTKYERDFQSNLSYYEIDAKKNITTFNKYIEKAIKIIKPNLSLRGFTSPSFDYNGITSQDDYRFMIKDLFHRIYDISGGHYVLGELFSNYERKLRHNYLDENDGKIMLDIITAIADATPKLKEGQSKDFLPLDCPVDWKEVVKSANNNNEDWFMASWVLDEETNIETGFIGDAWNSTFSDDFIPTSLPERNFYFEKINIKANARKHLIKWKKALGVI